MQNHKWIYFILLTNVFFCNNIKHTSKPQTYLQQRLSVNQHVLNYIVISVSNKQIALINTLVVSKKDSTIEPQNCFYDLNNFKQLGVLPKEFVFLQWEKNNTVLVMDTLQNKAFLYNYISKKRLQMPTLNKISSMAVDEENKIFTLSDSVYIAQKNENIIFLNNVWSDSKKLIYNLSQNNLFEKNYNILEYDVNTKAHLLALFVSDLVNDHVVLYDYYNKTVIYTYKLPSSKNINCSNIRFSDINNSFYFSYGNYASFTVCEFDYNNKTNKIIYSNKNLLEYRVLNFFIIDKSQILLNVRSKNGIALAKKTFGISDTDSSLSTNLFLGLATGCEVIKDVYN